MVRIKNVYEYTKGLARSCPDCAEKFLKYAQDLSEEQTVELGELIKKRKKELQGETIGRN